MSEICVVHLVRKKNGLEPFKCFLESYINNPAGITHDLLIIYKGFRGKKDFVPYEKLLKDVSHTFMMVADFGFDLRSYFVAAKKQDSRYFCFLNSFSVIQDNGWLLKLYRHISRPGVGVVGATGSWGSIRPGQRKNSEIPWVLNLARKFVGTCFGIFFQNFPNHHLRTNSFVIARENMLKIRHGIIFTKMQAWRLESGKNSITKQVEKLGLRPVVVGKDGKGYEKYEWDISNTFWRGTQNNLLIADNQTRKYDAADPEWKRRWELFAWGKLANGPQAKFAENS